MAIMLCTSAIHDLLGTGFSTSIMSGSETVTSFNVVVQIVIKVKQY